MKDVNKRTFKSKMKTLPERIKEIQLCPIFQSTADENEPQPPSPFENEIADRKNCIEELKILSENGGVIDTFDNDFESPIKTEDYFHNDNFKKKMDAKEGKFLYFR